MMIPIVQMINQSRRYFAVSFGLSLIRPDVMKVTMNMNKKANGSDTVVLDNGTSVIKMIPIRPPKIRRERIISEFMMFFIRSTSIPCVSYEIVILDLRRAFSQPILFKKVVSKFFFTTHFISKIRYAILYYKQYL